MKEDIEDNIFAMQKEKELKMYNLVLELIALPSERFEMLINLVEKGNEIENIMEQLHLGRGE